MAKTYTLTTKGANEAKTKGQQALITSDLIANPGSTIEQIAARIKPNLTTRQDPARVVAFYMSTWKKKGLVIVAGESGISDVSVAEMTSTVRPDPEDVAEETPVLPGNFDGNPPAGDIESTDNKPTLSERIEQFAKGRGENGFWPDDVVAELNGEVGKKKVQDSLRRLVSKSVLVRAESGEYIHADFDPTRNPVATE
jgi:hypothetical protein